MTEFKITQNCYVRKNEMHEFIYDADADFDQIILAVKWGVKRARIRLVSLGDAIEVEYWKDKSLISVVKVANDRYADNAVNNILTMIFA